MGVCKVCGGYASEGKSMCPFHQIRHGKFVNKKWIAILPADLRNQIGTGEIQYDSNGQMTFLNDGNGQEWSIEQQMGEGK